MYYVTHLFMYEGFLCNVFITSYSTSYSTSYLYLNMRFFNPEWFLEDESLSRFFHCCDGVDIDMAV